MLQVCPTFGTEHWVFNVTQQMVTKEYNGSSYQGFASTSSAATKGHPHTDSSPAWLCELFPGTCTPKAPFAQFWRPWSSYGRTAGYVTTLSPIFAFATVHDAGHEVPAYQPAAGLIILKNFLAEDGGFFASHVATQTRGRALWSNTVDMVGSTAVSWGVFDQTQPVTPLEGCLLLSVVWLVLVLLNIVRRKSV